jgi:hypothetical protein
VRLLRLLAVKKISVSARTTRRTRQAWAMRPYPSCVHILLHKSDQMNEAGLIAAKRRKRRKMGHTIRGELTVQMPSSSVFCDFCAFLRPFPVIRSTFLTAFRAEKDM